jgi:hypothetical protein
LYLLGFQREFGREAGLAGKGSWEKWEEGKGGRDRERE